MKRGKIIILFLIIILLIVPLASAGFLDWIKKTITGRVPEQKVDLNISVTTGAAPWIYNVSGLEAITLTDGPGATYITINFSVNDSDGVGNLDNSTAAVNLTNAAAPLRANSTCAFVNAAGNYANYTCNITLWWYDSDGAWTVYANISDNNGNIHVNDTHTRTVNSLTGLIMSPGNLTFTGSLLAGATNQTASNYLTLNNTGNQNISGGNVKVNATDLIGETNKGQALWAGNFSFHNTTGNKIECNVTGSIGATAMVNMTYTGVGGTVLNKGNFSKDDGTGQASLYLCLREVGWELSQQQYSTDEFGQWTVQIS